MAFLVLLATAAWTAIIASHAWHFLVVERACVPLHGRVVFPREFKSDPEAELLRTRIDTNPIPFVGPVKILAFLAVRLKDGPCFLDFVSVAVSDHSGDGRRAKAHAEVVSLSVLLESFTRLVYSI